LIKAVDVVLDIENVDPERIVVTGVSYGGFMTNWIIGHTQRFRTAVCENGISNLVSNFGTSGGGQAFWDWEMKGTPFTEMERYLERSPISYAADIRTPLLLIHAEQDHNCDIGQSEELYVALKVLRREVAFVRIPEEGHLMNLVGRPSRRLCRIKIIDAWLATHLQ
jgi:dipeptidyl aminopeptidase/acylaminoacyl peptidase